MTEGKFKVDILRCIRSAFALGSQQILREDDRACSRCQFPTPHEAPDAILHRIGTVKVIEAIQSVLLHALSRLIAPGIHEHQLPQPSYDHNHNRILHDLHLSGRYHRYSN